MLSAMCRRRRSIGAARRSASASVSATIAKAQTMTRAASPRALKLSRYGRAKRAVVRKQYAAGADAHAPRFGAQPRQEHLRARVRERRDGVVLGEPVPVVAELLSAAGEGERFLDRAPSPLAGNDRLLIQDRQLYCRRHPTPERTIRSTLAAVL